MYSFQKRGFKTVQTAWKNWIYIGLIAILVAIMITTYQTAQSPYNQIEKEATSIAKQAGLVNKTGFYQYNRNRTYDTVAGTTKTNHPIYIIIDQKSGHFEKINQSSGLSRNDVLTKVWDQKNPKKVLNVAIGKQKNTLVWEVTYLNQKGDLNYWTLNFKNGKTVQQINNL